MPSWLGMLMPRVEVYVRVVWLLVCTFVCPRLVRGVDMSTVD